MDKIYLSRVDGLVAETRRFIEVSDEDRAKFDALPDGITDARAEVTDLKTGKTVKVGREECGLSCCCAAKMETV